MGISNSKDALKGYFDELLADAESTVDDIVGGSNPVDVNTLDARTVSASNAKAAEVESTGISDDALSSDALISATPSSSTTTPSSSTTIPSSTTASPPHSEGAGIKPTSTLAKEKDWQQVAPKERSALTRAQSLNGLNPQAEKRSRPELLEEPKQTELQEADADSLREEQKRKLQALLNQRTVDRIDLQTDAKPVITKTATQKSSSVSEQVSVPKAERQAEHQVERHVVTDQSVSVDDAGLEQETALSDGFHCAQAHEIEWAENGRPMWAQEDFDALLFDVGGLTLAVPLVALGQIFPLDRDELTPIFGQSDWFMGMLATNLGRMRVVNTALFVMPEKYDESFAEHAQFAISLDGVPWALAVNKVNQPIRLKPDEIKWRTERSKRPWLAGTVKSAMCALIDVPKMAKLLNASDRRL